MTLTRKILTALLGMTAFSLAVAVGALYPMMKLHTEQLVAARFQDSLAPTARAVDNLLLDAVRGMYLHVEDRAIRDDTPAEMTARLRNFTYVYPYMRRIYLANLQGKILSSVGSGRCRSLGGRAHARTARQFQQRPAAAGRFGRAGEPDARARCRRLDVLSHGHRARRQPPHRRCDDRRAAGCAVRGNVA